MAKTILIGMICLVAMVFAPLLSEEDKQTITAPGFDGTVLGMRVQAESLGVVLDISESMQRSLPAVRAELLKKLPTTPVLHVDGGELEKPGPLATVKQGVASETVTAVTLLAEFAEAKTILWITDMGDPPNRSGVEAMTETLSQHSITLYLLSLKNRPGPSLRKIVEHTEGSWEVIYLDDSGKK